MTDQKPELVRYHTESGFYPALVTETRKYLHVLTLQGSRLTTRKVAKSERRHMSPLLYKDKPYPKTRALRVFRRYAKARLGMRKSARQALARLGGAV